MFKTPPICYDLPMLQRQRVFSLTNTIINCLFMALILLCGVYFISFWIEMKPSFLETMVSIVNIAAWCVTGLSVAMVAIALWISFSDSEFQVGKLVWCIIRMAICILLTIFVDVCSILVAGEISVSL